MRKSPFFRMPIPAVALMLALPMIFTSACRRVELPFRFIDRLEAKNVAVSPLKPPAAKPGQKSSDREWVEALLQDLVVQDPSVGKNPWSLEKKLILNGEAAPALLAVPPTELRFRLKIPGRCFLRFGCGLCARSWGKDAHPTVFEILVEDDREIRRIFGEPHSLGNMHGRGLEIRRVIDLAAYQGKTVTLIFRTHAVPSIQPDEGRSFALKNGVAFWINPVLVRKRVSGAGPASLPNIVLVSIDTVRADHIGAYGYPLPTSPSADRLVRDSALFSSCFSGAPYTLASHATILTGLYPTRHQTLYLETGLPTGIPTLAEILRAGGYETAAFTGGGQLNVRYGFAKGFDEYNEVAGANQRIDSAHNLRRKAALWLESHRDSKFFLFLHTYQPHNPYRSPEFPGRESFLRKDFPWNELSLQGILGHGFRQLFRSLTPFERENVTALYDTELRYSDQFLIGPLVEDLKRLNLYENSLIILTSDHGEEFFDHAAWEHGHTLYNELIHVPLVIKFPGSRYAGRRIDRTVGSVDIAPTVLEAAGLESPAGVKFDGENLIGLLEGKEEAARTRMSFMPAGFAYDFPSRVAVIRGDDKLILNGEFLPGAGDYFSPPPPPRVPVELFNLADDPLEKNNLVDREGAKVRELLSLAQAFLKEAQAEAGRRKIVLDDKLQEQLKSLGYIR